MKSRKEKKVNLDSVLLINTLSPSMCPFFKVHVIQFSHVEQPAKISQVYFTSTVKAPYLPSVLVQFALY